MLAVTLLVFREVMEAALIVSVVCAATRGVTRRGWFVSAGIGLGVAGATLVALGAGVIDRLAQGNGQDLFNAFVLLSAVAMIGWHVTWMSKHGRELAEHMQSLGGAVKAGASSLAMLLAVVALAVLREGSEIVLFLYSMALGGIGAIAMAGGIALGIGGGAVFGFAMYFGLLRVPTRYFFGVTNAMLVLLASGLAATAAGFLLQGNLLPPMGGQLWNTSWLLSNGSLAGKTLGILIGYNAAPAGIQVLFYGFTLLLLTGGMHWQSRPARARISPALAVPHEAAPTTKS